MAIYADRKHLSCDLFDNNQLIKLTLVIVLLENLATRYCLEKVLAKRFPN